MVGSSATGSPVWDYIVVGTGMGGGTLGHALARAGQRVLFCEKGRAALEARSDRYAGDYAEESFSAAEAPHGGHRELLARAGRCFDLLSDGGREFVPFIGTGAGGSSALYGMALERFFPSDFEPTAGGTGVAGWPISYDGLASYYEAAERLYRVRGDGDPLRQGERFGYMSCPPMTPSNQELADHLRGKGLHPYHLPLACEFLDGCRGCQGYLCARGCKNDSARTCVEPAIRQHGAQLLDQCTATRILCNGDAVTGIACLHRGEERVLHAKNIVLAAGALVTPVLLLNSACEAWPDGLANRSGLVGRFLMRHLIDLYAVFPKRGRRIEGNVKELAFNDYYQVDGEKLGSFQSFGYMPPPAVIVAEMERDLRRDAGALAAMAFRPARPFMRWFLGRVFSRALVFASILEDLPHRDNRVRPDGSGGGVRIDYAVRDADRARVEAFRKRLAEVLKPYRFMLIKQAENNERIAHCCGTCRFGDDPATSVLDRNNRAHGIRNLYVVDSSFFPSSGGTNPSLTIAANALRVAEHLTGSTP